MAPIGEKLRGMLGFLEKLTITPEQVGPHDVAALEEIGITYRAITDAVYICMGFNIINRIADAMGFEVPEPGVFVRGAWYMRRFGYSLMSGSWWPERKSLSATSDPYDHMMRCLTEAVFRGPGTLESTVRQAYGSGVQMGGVLGHYVNKVAQRDYKEIDACIADLRSRGYSDDQVFEATVSAAVGAGVKRLQLALQPFRGSLASQAA